jgi:hypothetical protein
MFANWLVHIELDVACVCIATNCTVLEVPQL